VRRKLEQQQGLLDEPAELEESDFLESIARTIFRKGGGLLGELLNPAETGLDEGYLDDQGRLVVTEPLVRERNFRNWFGDSVVKSDRDGKPLLVYHGTPNEFTEFSPGMFGSGKAMGRGNYFTETPESAKRWGEWTSNYGDPVNVYEGYLQIKKPYYLDADVSSISMAEQMPDEFWEWMATEYEDQTAREYLDSGREYLDEQDSKKYDDDITDWLQKQGYDGVIGEYDGETHHVIFEPTQFKNIKNRGTYNPDDPDMYSMNMMKKGLLYG